LCRKISATKAQDAQEIRAVPWSSHNLIWQVRDTSRWDIREKEEMKNLFEFILHEVSILQHFSSLLTFRTIKIMVNTERAWVI
jgi:hypothetical protein